MINNYLAHCNLRSFSPECSWYSTAPKSIKKKTHCSWTRASAWDTGRNNHRKITKKVCLILKILINFLKIPVNVMKSPKISLPVAQNLKQQENWLSSQFTLNLTSETLRAKRKFFSWQVMCIMCFLSSTVATSSQRRKCFLTLILIVLSTRTKVACFNRYWWFI